MSNYDPRIVAQALEDLQSEVTRWSSVASDTLASVTNTQRHANEAVDRALHNSAIVLDRAKNDDENVQNALSFVAIAVEKCTTSTITANNTFREAQSELQNADLTLRKWQAELQKALAWLARAEARLAKANQALDHARGTLRSAEWDLSSAESRLRNCQNDENRRNCSGESSAVSRARSNVSRAQQLVRVAELEVIAAKEEVARAKARVDCCNKAVAYSTQAVNLANESVSSANQAVNSAERSLEFANAADRLVRIAKEKMLAEVESAESMMSETRAAQELTNNAITYLNIADKTEGSAQIYATALGKELEHRLQQLNDLNRPSIGLGDLSLPKNFSPSEIKSYKRSDGKTQFIYGNERDKSGQITGPHGHTVVDENGNIDYARTQKGHVKLDTGE